MNTVHIGGETMKKMVKTAFIYSIAAMIGGVFYREFTKFNGFTGRTTLSFVHTHLFLLGMVMFLIAGLYTSKLEIQQTKHFKLFYIIYNIGVPITAIMLLVRGIIQVLNINLSTALNASISGIAGIGHILTGIGIIFFFLSLIKEAK